jgi:hypothetical protein
MPASRRLPLEPLILAALVAACSPASRDAAPEAARATTVTLAVPDRHNAHASIAAHGRLVVVAWSASSDSVTDIFTATSQDGGESFTPPVRVNSVDGEAEVNSEMPPRVALVPRDGSAPAIVVVWTTKSGDRYRLLHARSDDGGAHYTPTAIVPGGDGPGDRGWQSVAVDSAGRVVVVWLDHRGPDGAPAAPQLPRPADAAPPTESERFAARSMLFASTLDGAEPRRVIGGVCYCCKTSSVAAGGSVVSVWRHVFPGSERDIALSASHDGGATFTEPVRVSEDRWVFDGCPDNGPAVAVDRARRAHVLWVTPAAGADVSRMELYHAVSATDLRSFSPRRRVETAGVPGHAQLALEATGALLVTWDETGGGGRQVKLARATVADDATTTITPLPSPDEARGHDPVVAATEDAGVVAWVRPGATPVEWSVIAVARVR